MPPNLLLALHNAGIDGASADDAAELQLASFNLILRAATPVLRRLFLLRWLAFHGQPWRDTADCGCALLAATAQPRPTASGAAVRAAIAAGDSARWDITTLAHVLLRSPLLTYRPLDAGRIGDWALVSAVVAWRNRVCHHAGAAPAEVRAAAAAAAAHIEELARRCSAPDGPAGPALRLG